MKSHKILISETQSISRRSISRINLSTDNSKGEEYIENFLRTEVENKKLKLENRLLSEEIQYIKKINNDEQELVFASVVSFALNQRT